MMLATTLLEGLSGEYVVVRSNLRISKSQFFRTLKTESEASEVLIFIKLVSKLYFRLNVLAFVKTRRYLLM